jgi:hypothetical protein
MTPLILPPVPMNGMSAAHAGVLAAAAGSGQGVSSFVVIAILVAVFIVVALAKLLRGLLTMIAPLISSAGAVLMTLIGVGALLITTVLTVFSTR